MFIGIIFKFHLYFFTLENINDMADSPATTGTNSPATQTNPSEKQQPQQPKHNKWKATIIAVSIVVAVAISTLIIVFYVYPSQHTAPVSTPTELINTHTSRMYQLANTTNEPTSSGSTTNEPTTNKSTTNKSTINSVSDITVGETVSKNVAESTIQPIVNTSADPICLNGTFDPVKGKCILPDDTLYLTGSRIAGCPNGYILQDGVCILDSDKKPIGQLRLADCPPDYTNTKYKCYRPSMSKENTDYINGICPDGYKFQNGVCVSIEDRYPNPANRLADCPDDYINSNGQCVKSLRKYVSGNRPASCPSGYYNDSGTCKRAVTSIIPYVRDADCPPDYDNINGQCVRPALDYIQDSLGPSCPDGFYFNNATGKCTKPEDRYGFELLSTRADYPTGAVQDPIDKKYYLTTKSIVNNPTAVSGTLKCTMPGDSSITGTYDSTLKKCVIPAGTKITNYSYLADGVTKTKGNFIYTDSTKSALLTDKNGNFYYNVTYVDPMSRPGKADAQPVGVLSDYNTKVTLKGYTLVFDPASVTCPTDYISDMGNTYNNVLNTDSNCYKLCSSIGSEYSNSLQGTGKCTQSIKTEVQKICPTGSTRFNNTDFCYADCKPGYNKDLKNDQCVRPAVDATNDQLVCPAGYNLGTDGLCYKKCNSKYTQKDYKTCTKPSDTQPNTVMTCSSNEILYNGKCYTKCPTGYTFDKGTCIADTTDSNVLTCLSNEVLVGNTCYQTCPPGYTLDKTTGNCVMAADTTNTVTCQTGEVKYNGKCYAYCPDNHNQALDTCFRMGGNQLNNQYMSCPEGYAKYNELCYKRCPVGSKNLLTTCYLPDDTKDASAMTCKDHELLEDTSCREKCPDGYSIVDGKCYRPPNPNITTPNVCKDNEVMLDNFCYPKCPEDYVNTVNGCIRKNVTKDPTCPSDYPNYKDGKCYK